MRVTITLDFYDGRKNKVRVLDLADGFSMQDVMFALMRREVAGVTITRYRKLTDMAEMTEAEEGC